MYASLYALTIKTPESPEYPDMFESPPGTTIQEARKTLVLRAFSFASEQPGRHSRAAYCYTGIAPGQPPQNLAGDLAGRGWHLRKT